MDHEIQKRRLRWKCRRGMLELDILLIHFFDQCYDQLNAHEQQLFQIILDQDDVVLYAWFMEAEEPLDLELRALVNQISSVQKS